MNKRKRPVSQKRKQSQGHGQQQQQPPDHHYYHPVISQYYRQVVSLRQYLLSQLPGSSKVRRRRLASLGASGNGGGGGGGGGAGGALHDDLRGPDRALREPAHVPELVRLLDTTLVGVLHESSATVSQERREGLVMQAQSQSQARSQLEGTCTQSEIVEYVVGLLLNQNPNGYQRAQHLLAQGFQRFSGAGNEHRALSNIPGIVVQFENKNVQTLQRVPWTDVLDLLGSNGEEIMLRLLLDCAVFRCIDDRKGVYYQLSGLPLSALEPLEKPSASNLELAERPKDKLGQQPKPNNIVFLRRRALYARPALNARGEVRFGLKHDHALNRLSSAESLHQTVSLLQCMFPRQFGLPNVFTAGSSPQSLLHRPVRLEDQEETPKIPKRLRGTLVELVQGLQRRNKHCAYTELLRYYCPDTNGPWKLPEASDPGSTPTSTSQPLTTQVQVQVQQQPELEREQLQEPKTQQNSQPKVPPPKYSLTDHATPAASVSAFCRAVLRKLIPPGFFGTGEHGLANKRAIFMHVDRFVRMRRFESLNLHEVCQGLKITCIPWLATPPQQQQQQQQSKLCRSDTQKRTELLHEFVYFLFDSIVIPLLRTNFYVTESQTHRNRLFFFRHDVWRRLTEQPLADLKSNVFEELKPDAARRVLGRRTLGYSSLRLLPKTTGVRPILNLRRRTWIKSRWPGKQGASYLGPSINSSITPVYHMLGYERTRGPDALGSSLNSVGDIHLRLRSFKERFLGQQQQQHHQQQQQLPPLYFVKLDIQSCFDTIPQQKLIRLIEELVSEETYQITKHVELRPADEFGPSIKDPGSKQVGSKPQKKFVGRAAPATKAQSLPDAFASGVTSRRRNTVFVDTQHREHHSEDLLDLLDEHVRNNLVRIGKKYFRQRNGIPQGSMLSSLLCNYFYAELEREVLHPFVDPTQALLLRLIDDFLLVTSNKDLAVGFLQCMLRGHPAYGITVNASKSLTNFSAALDGVQIPRLNRSDHCFPYCGNLIHTQTLEISRDQHRALDGGSHEGNAAADAAQALSNTLTVESARSPGRALHRKVLTGFKLQMHPMYLDTEHNSRTAVMANLYANMVTSAMKMVRYLKALGPSSRRGGRHSPDGQSVVIRVIQDLTQLAQRLLRSRQDPDGGQGRRNKIPPVHVSYLTTSAFRFVLGRKQTRYAQVLRWLDGVGRTTRPKSDLAAVRVAQVVRDGNLAFGGWRF